MKYKKTIFSAVPFCAVLALSGCGVSETVASVFDGSNSATKKKSSIIVVDSTPESIAHYALGRDYAASGRYELAREQYALALAAANNPEMQQSLVLELDSVDMMIKSLR